jgi:hypothetical protein
MWTHGNRATPKPTAHKIASIKQVLWGMTGAKVAKDKPGLLWRIVAALVLAPSLFACRSSSLPSEKPHTRVPQLGSAEIVDFSRDGAKCSYIFNVHEPVGPIIARLKGLVASDPTWQITNETPTFLSIRKDRPGAKVTAIRISIGSGKNGDSNEIISGTESTWSSGIIQEVVL